MPDPTNSSPPFETAFPGWIAAESADARTAAALLELEMLEPIDVAAFARMKLKTFPSAILELLAAETTPPAVSCGPLLRAALAEMNVAVPVGREACLIAGVYIASLVLRGQLTPYRGASVIWVNCENKTMTPDAEWDRLSNFRDLATEYEDEDRPKEEIELDIAELCRSLVEG